MESGKCASMCGHTTSVGMSIKCDEVNRNVAEERATGYTIRRACYRCQTLFRRTIVCIIQRYCTAMGSLCLQSLENPVYDVPECVHCDCKATEKHRIHFVLAERRLDLMNPLADELNASYPFRLLLLFAIASRSISMNSADSPQN